MIKVLVPNNFQSERAYILKVLLSEFLGLNFGIQFHDQESVVITAGDQRKLIIEDSFFSTAKDQWLKPDSLPTQPLKTWYVSKTPFANVTLNKKIPVIFGRDPEGAGFYSNLGDKIHLGLDIFGSAFFMLTRYEEVIKQDKDKHDRFPAVASLAYQEGFLERPIINEYLEILWACLTFLWPRLQRSSRTFTICASHDVDRPYFYYNLNFSRQIKRAISDLVKKKRLEDPELLWQGIKDKFDLRQSDPYNTFHWLMDQNENNQIQASFNFLCGGMGDDYGPNYTLNDPSIRRLIRQINVRGHKIGFHGSYNTVRDSEQMQREVKLLRRVLKHEKIPQDKLGGRQHFLRWKAPTTWQLWEENGLSFDSTLGYPEQVGFRCGICYDFPVFNLHTSKSLTLRERPLIIMDVSMIGENYMDMDHETALKKMLAIKDCVRHHQGNFEILWHNCWFNGDESRFAFYTHVIDPKT